MDKNIKSAFSLVELSIVLVIIGLIVGGVTVGQDMIENAKMKATIKKINEYSVAITTFKDKYFYYPGDLVNAWDYWQNTGDVLTQLSHMQWKRDEVSACQKACASGTIYI